MQVIVFILARIAGAHRRMMAKHDAPRSKNARDVLECISLLALEKEKIKNEKEFKWKKMENSTLHSALHGSLIYRVRGGKG